MGNSQNSKSNSAQKKQTISKYPPLSQEIRQERVLKSKIINSMKTSNPKNYQIKTNKNIHNLQSQNQIMESKHHQIKYSDANSIQKPKQTNLTQNSESLNMFNHQGDQHKSNCLHHGNEGSNIKRLLIEVKIDDWVLFALIDTGSKKNLINDSVLTKCNLNGQASFSKNLKLFSVGFGKTSIIGNIPKLIIQIANYEFVINSQICKEGINLLLGMDFLYKYECIIDPLNKLIKVKKMNLWVPCLCDEEIISMTLHSQILLERSSLFSNTDLLILIQNGYERINAISMLLKAGGNTEELIHIIA